MVKHDISRQRYISTQKRKVDEIHVSKEYRTNATRVRLMPSKRLSVSFLEAKICCAYQFM